MAMFGKFNCFCVATKGGDVIYERFYDRLSEAEKAEVRAAFFQASSGAGLVDGQDRSAAYRWAIWVRAAWMSAESACKRAVSDVQGSAACAWLHVHGRGCDMHGLDALDVHRVAAEGCMAHQEILRQG